MSCACAMEPRHQLKLVNIIKHSAEVYSYDFEKSPIDHWEEGDSSKIFLTVNGSEVGKAFSYATLPSEGHIRFTTRIKEQASDYKKTLSSLELGDHIEVTEPKGEFGLRRENRPIVLLSNGVGIAATRSLVKAFEEDQNGVPLLFQLNVDNTGAIYEDEFREISGKIPSFKSKYTQNRTDFYESLKGIILNLWENEKETPLFYTVGSQDFVNGTLKYLYEGGYTDQDVVTDASGCGCSSGGGCGSKKVVSILSFVS